jgi:hypothetical protein
MSDKPIRVIPMLALGFAVLALSVAMFLAPFFWTTAPVEKKMEVFLFYSAQDNPGWQQELQNFHTLQEQYKLEAKFLAIDVGGFGAEWKHLVAELTGVTVAEETDLLVAPLHIFVQRRVVGTRVALIYLRNYEKADSTKLAELFTLLRETEMVPD